MVIGFTGHRDKLCKGETLHFFAEHMPDSIWVHGGAVGFDNQVKTVAELNGKTTENGLQIVVRPDYQAHSPKQAPILRNFVIVDMCNLLIAFYDGRQSGGTFSAISYARAKQKPVIILRA